MDFLTSDMTQGMGLGLLLWIVTLGMRGIWNFFYRVSTPDNVNNED